MKYKSIVLTFWPIVPTGVGYRSEVVYYPDENDVLINPATVEDWEIVNKRYYRYSHDGEEIEPLFNVEDPNENDVPLIIKKINLIEDGRVLYFIYVPETNANYKNITSRVGSNKNGKIKSAKDVPEAEEADQDLKIATNILRSYGEIPPHHLINLTSDTKYADILLSKLFDKL